MTRKITDEEVAAIRRERQKDGTVWTVDEALRAEVARLQDERDATIAEVRRLTAELSNAGRPRYSGDASVAVEDIDAAFNRGVEAMREAAAKACESHWLGGDREPARETSRVLAVVATDIRALKVAP
jgi:hypothetical protein